MFRHCPKGREYPRRKIEMFHYQAEKRGCALDIMSQYETVLLTTGIVSCV